MSPLAAGNISPIRTVLASVSLSERGIAVAAETHRIARAHGANAIFLHVGEDTPGVRDALEGIIRAACGDIGAATVSIRPGKVDDVVCSCAEEYDAGLIVAGALQREGMLGYYIGSVARKIARKARRSVVLITAPSAESRPLRAPAVRLDIDAASKEALAFAAAFVLPFGAESLHVLYEYELPALRAGLEDASDIHEEEQVQAQFEAEEEAKLHAFIDDIDFSGLTVHAHCLLGRRGVQASEYCVANGFDLLITAAPRRRLGLLDKIFQHDVEYALESLPCDFLMFRPQATDESTED